LQVQSRRAFLNGDFNIVINDQRLENRFPAADPGFAAEIALPAAPD
jgi:hypothetical protein